MNYELYLIIEEMSSSNAKIRQKAEEKIKKLAEENLGELLIDLCRNITNIEIKKEIRQINSNLFQNILIHPLYTQNYLDLSSEIKNQIKDEIFLGFNSNDQYIRISSALALCVIAKIELSRNQFLYIYDIFYENIKKQNINIQLSTIIAINFIIKEAKKDSIIISNENMLKIMETFYMILKNEEKNFQLILDVLKSIKLNLSYIIEYLNSTNKNLYFYDLLLRQVNHKSIEIRNIVLSIFLELIKE